jgi:hypothetical protein
MNEDRFTDAAHLTLRQIHPCLLHVWHKAIVPLVWIADKLGADFIVDTIFKIHVRVLRWGISR